MFTSIFNRLFQTESQIQEVDQNVPMLVCLASDSSSDIGDQALSFTDSFLVGNDASCDVRLDDERITAKPAQVYRLGDLWWVRDLGSDDGIYLDEELIDAAPINGSSTLRFGEDGPMVWLQTGSEAGWARQG